MLQLKTLPAGYGDALLFHWQHESKSYNVLIDGGIQKIFQNILLPEIQELQAKNEALDIVVNTHIDFDHITGILDLAQAMEDNKLPKEIVKRWWFNSGKLISKYFNLPPFTGHAIYLDSDEEADDSQVSLKQGVSLETLLEGFGNWHNYLITNEQPPFVLGGATFTILSPDKKALKKLGEKWEQHAKEEKSGQAKRLEDDYDRPVETLAQRKYSKDYSAFNRSSIAFLFEFQEKSILFLGDAVPETYVPALEKIIKTRRGTELHLRPL